MNQATASPAAPRILVGQLFQEAHGFTPLRTPLEAFAMETGEAVVHANLQADSVLGGILRTGQQQGWQIIPTIAARASPGGRVLDAAYEALKRPIVERARQGGFDAIALCLHGCIQTESLDSAEADLLAELRAIVGPDLPIVAGFDLHAHAGGGMLAHLDFATAYKTNPHGDAGATGERLGGVLADMLAGRVQPHGAQVLVPMFTRGNDETATGPLAALHGLIAQRLAAEPALLDASIFNVNPFIDGEGVGQTVLVYARHAQGLPAAAQLADSLAEGLWAARDDFVHQLPTLPQARDCHPGPLVVGDFGDRVLAGAPGDSIAVLREVQERWPGQRVVAPLTDPEALAACQRAGAGQALRLSLGGCYTPGRPSITLEGTVRALGDGSYRNRGAFMRGAQLRIGPYAVLEGEHWSLLITEQPLMSQDPGCFLDCGIDLATASFIVAKSGYHFKLAFGDYGTCVCVATPGLSNYDPQTLPITKARPLYPLDQPVFEARALPTRSASSIATAPPSAPPRS
jgi:microcystin degradation protein MlrC